MAVYKLSGTSVKNGRTEYSSFLAGNPAYTPPTYYESIATVTVGSGGSSSISFTSIPATYTHLQIRYMTLFSQANYAGYIQFNSDTASNYAWHRIFGSGSTVTAGNATSQSNGLFGLGAASSTNTPGGGVTDILDYDNTNKFKTVRDLSGTDANGNGYIQFASSLWRSTSAITSIQLSPASGVYNQYSQFALYGIKES